MTTAINIIVGDRQFRESVQTRFAEPVALPQSTVGDVDTDYPAADWPYCVVALTDGTGNKFLAVSNGSAWYYMDGNAV